MKIRCNNCGLKFLIDDSTLSREGINYHCPGCEESVVVKISVEDSDGNEVKDGKIVSSVRRGDDLHRMSTIQRMITMSVRPFARLGQKRSKIRNAPTEITRFDKAANLDKASSYDVDMANSDLNRSSMSNGSFFMLLLIIILIVSSIIIFLSNSFSLQAFLKFFK